MAAKDARGGFPAKRSIPRNKSTSKLFYIQQFKELAATSVIWF